LTVASGETNLKPPEQPWTTMRIVLWAVACLVVVLWLGRGFLQDMRPRPDLTVDFFQEWASARLHFDGLPVYGDQVEALTRYRGFSPEPGKPFNLVNAHPPAAVLIALPLAFLSYSDACLAWNLLSLVAGGLSLWIIIRQLRLSFSPFALLPLVTLLLLCHPFRAQVEYGQLNLLLLLLIVGAWAAERSDRPYLAGFLLGSATAIKLFPGFLFLYPLARRQWRVLTAGALSVALWTGLTVAVLGIDTWRDYAEKIVPYLARTYRASWPNISLNGFWYRVFEGYRKGEHTIPLWDSPEMARWASVICFLTVTAVVAVVVFRARSRAECDRAFGLTVTATLLVSPITWSHYLVLLLLPVTLLYLALPPQGIGRGVLLICLILIWLSAAWFWALFITPRLERWFTLTAQPWQNFAALSVHTYAMLAIFVLGVLSARDPEKRPEEKTNPESVAAPQPTHAQAGA
jgi:hypothetical protein